MAGAAQKSVYCGERAGGDGCGQGSVSVSEGERDGRTNSHVSTAPFATLTGVAGSILAVAAPSQRNVKVDEKDDRARERSSTDIRASHLLPLPPPSPPLRLAICCCLLAL